MIDLCEVMQFGNEKQKNAFLAIKELNIFNDLESFRPMLCGTIPLGIDIEGSDLDLVFEVKEPQAFEEKLMILYSEMENFRIKRKMIRGREVVKANFIYMNFEFELFGQNQPVHKQNAYLHMFIEYKLLQRFPELRSTVIDLKKQGYKTEPAFCKLLNIPGDPYKDLIQFGWDKGLIKRESF